MPGTITPWCLTRVKWLDWMYAHWSVPDEEINDAPKGYLDALKWYRSHEAEFRVIWLAEWRRFRDKVDVGFVRAGERRAIAQAHNDKLEMLKAEAAVRVEAKAALAPIRRPPKNEEDDAALAAREHDAELERAMGR